MKKGKQAREREVQGGSEWGKRERKRVGYEGKEASVE